MRRVAGEEVAPRGAVDGQEAAPVGVAALDLGGSSGCAHAMTWSRSFSYQRNPRMSSLRPCRMPHTLAPVCELQSQCHSVSAWLPLPSQRANVGMSPSRTARRTVSKPRPSTCRNSRSSGVRRVSAYRESTAGRRYVLRHGRPSSFAQRNAWTAALNQIDAGVLVGGPGA